MVEVRNLFIMGKDLFDRPGIDVVFKLKAKDGGICLVAQGITGGKFDQDWELLVIKKNKNKHLYVEFISGLTTNDIGIELDGEFISHYHE